MLIAGWATQAQPLQRVAPEEVGMDSRLLTNADKLIEEAIAEKRTPGAVLAVVRHGKLAYLKAYGHKQTEPTVADTMTTNTIFDMASCSKTLGTTLCVMKLIEQGKIRLIDAVETHLPGFKNWESKDGKRKRFIRIEDLLTHASGLPAYASVNEVKKQYGAPNPKGLMDYIAGWRRDFEPKTDFQYSCLNFITLQNIVEKVSGQSLRDFAQENIYGPLGLKATDYLPCKQDEKGFWYNTDFPYWSGKAGSVEEKIIKQKDIEPYLKDIAPTEIQKETQQALRGQVHDPLARVLNAGISGNAGLFTCAEDVALLCAMIMNDGTWNGKRILSPLACQLMFTVPSWEQELGRTYGWDAYSSYSSNKGDLLSRSAICHTGYTGTSIAIDKENDISIILLTNTVHPHDNTSTLRTRALVFNAVAGSIIKEDSTQSPKYTAHYYKRFVQFMDEAPISENDIIMLGNSLTEGGGDWSKRLGIPNVRNRGIIGDEITGIQDRLHQILPYHPKKVLLMIGVNDVSHQLSTDSIMSMYTSLVKTIRTASPHTQLILQSLLPINESFGRYKRLTGKTEQIPEINARIKKLAKTEKLTYIDLFPLFCEKGTHSMRADISTDGLHLKEEGYAIWAKAIKNKI